MGPLTVDQVTGSDPAGTPREVPPGADGREPPASAGRHRRTVAAAASVALGCGLLWLALRAGSPVGRAVRAAVVVAGTAATVGVLLRAGRRVAGAVGTAIGLVGAAVGAGICGQWLGEGWSVTALAGVALLAGGVVLAVAAAGLLLGGLRRPVAWGGSAGVLLVALLLAAVVSIPVAATNVPPGPRPPAATELGGRRAEEVAFPARDGVRLAAWWVPSRNGAAVVVLPGAGSTRAAAAPQADVLAAAGYGVLVLDHRGHGASEGTAMDFGWHGDDDVRGALDEVARRMPPGSRLGLLGLSMGGEEALGAMPADDRIAAVVAEGATNRSAADKGWLSDEYGLAGVVQEQLDRVTYGVADLLTGASPPTPLARAVRRSSPTPVLVVAAGQVPDEPLVARRLRAAAPGRVQVWVVPEAGHTGGLRAEPEWWERRVVGFLDEHLLGGG